MGGGGEGSIAHRKTGFHRDLESTHSKYLKNCVYCFFKSTSAITFDNGSGMTSKTDYRSNYRSNVEK